MPVVLQPGGAQARVCLVAVHVFAVPDAVKHHVTADNVIAHPVGPYFQPPLTDAFALELLHSWGRAERIGLERGNRPDDFLLCLGG